MTKKKHKPNFLLVLPLLLFGSAILFYPAISGYLVQKNQSRVVENYQAFTDELSKQEIQREKESADEFNRLLYQQNGEIFGSYGSLEKRYWNELNLDGVMGYISIPAIGVRLPIVHGTTDEDLRSACGHVKGSSLPVGGENTHTVLSGHRGLPNAKLFTDLDQLTVGDMFYLHILDTTLAYQIVNIKTIMPDDVKSLGIESGKDLATLVTCTPYGINTRRLLITGTRVKYNPEQEKNIKPVSTIPSYAAVTYYLMTAAALLALCIIILIPLHYRKKAAGKQKRK